MMNTDISDTSDYLSGDQGVSPVLDATLDLLSNKRRRYVLYYLRDEEGSVTVDELAEQVLAWETDAADHSPSLGPSDDTPRERVSADLHHCQLPRLAESGAVNYDPDEEYVSLATADGELIMEYLDLAASEESVR